MQIDLVITELNMGGAEKTLTRLAIGLHNLGDDVRVYSIGPLPSPSRDGDPGDLLVRTLRESGIDVRSGDAGHPLQTPSAFWDLRRWLAQRPTGIGQSFLVHANILTMAAESTLPRSGKSLRRAIGGIRVAERRRHRLWAERTAFRRADHVVCVSAAVRSFAIRHLGLTESKTSVIANAVDVEAFATADPFAWPAIGLPADSDVVLFIGRYHEQKNLAFLQQNFDEIIAADSHRRLVTVGDGPLRGELIEWAAQVNRRHSGPPRVVVLPSRTEIASLIAASRVLVLPSHYEGMPNVVLEAMAGGRPVVCSRVEGSDELIGDDETQGYDPGDAAGFVGRVNRFLEDIDFATRVGKANRKRVERDFSVQAMVNAYRDRYRQLL